MRTILAAEDSRTTRMVLEKILAEAGYAPVLAQDGQEALEMLIAGREVDAILVDINMPRMDGIELIRRVSAMPRAKPIPCIVLSTEGDRTLIDKARAVGARGWMVKPVNAAKLVDVLGKLFYDRMM